MCIRDSPRWISSVTVQVDVLSDITGGCPQLQWCSWMSSVTTYSAGGRPQVDVLHYSKGGHPQVDVLSYTYSALVHLGWRGVGMPVNISTCEK